MTLRFKNLKITNLGVIAVVAGLYSLRQTWTVTGLS